jgi:hypothetical protein
MKIGKWASQALFTATTWSVYCSSCPICLQSELAPYQSFETRPAAALLFTRIPGSEFLVSDRADGAIKCATGGICCVERFLFAIFMVFVRDLTQWGGQTDLRSMLLQLLVTMALMSCLIFASGFIAKRSNKKEKGGSS